MVHPMSEAWISWQPISTAVKDGEPRLLAGSDWIDVGCWVPSLNSTDDPGWTCHRVKSWSYEEEAHCYPTHWAPLPGLPHSEQQRETGER
jgi:hypothetical protein